MLLQDRKLIAAVFKEYIQAAVFCSGFSDEIGAGKRQLIDCYGVRMSRGKVHLGSSSERNGYVHAKAAGIQTMILLLNIFYK